MVNVTVQDLCVCYRDLGVTECLGAQFPDKLCCDTTKVLYKEQVRFHMKMQSLYLGGKLAEL